MMNLAEYRRHSQSLADFLPWAALVAQASSSTRTAASSAPRGFAGPTSTRATPGRTGRDHRPAQQRAAPAGLGLGDLRRGAAPARAAAIRGTSFPMPPRGLVDDERRAQFEEEGAHFESRYFLTLLWLPPADDAARAEAWLYEDRAPGRRRLARRARRLRRPHRPGAGPDRRLHARGRVARRRRDADLSAFLRSRPAASACACPRRRCISTRSWPTRR